MWRKGSFVVVVGLFLIIISGNILSEEIFFNVWADRNEYRIGEVATIYYTCNTQVEYELWYNHTKLIVSGILEPNKQYDSKVMVEGPLGEATITFIIKYKETEIVFSPYPGGQNPFSWSSSQAETVGFLAERIKKKEKTIIILVKEKEIPKIPRILLNPKIPSTMLNVGEQTKISIAMTNNGNGDAPNVFLYPKVDPKFILLSSSGRYSGNIKAGENSQYEITLQPILEGNSLLGITGEYYDEKAKKYTISPVTYEFIIAGKPNLQISIPQGISFKAKETKSIIIKIENVGNGEARNIKIKFGMIPDLYILNIEKEKDTLESNSAMEISLNVTTDKSGEYILPIEVIYSNIGGEQLQSLNSITFNIGIAEEILYASIAVIIIIGLSMLFFLGKKGYWSKIGELWKSGTYCPSCGAKNSINSYYCNKCGGKMRNQEN